MMFRLHRLNPKRAQISFTVALCVIHILGSFPSAQAGTLSQPVVPPSPAVSSTGSATVSPAASPAATLLDAAIPHIPIWSAQDITTHCSDLQASQEKGYAELASIPLTRLREHSLLARWNTLQAQEEDVSGPVGVLANVSPDPAIREAAERCELKLAEAGFGILQNADLYARLNALTVSNPIDLRWKEQMLREFEEAGAKLDAPRKARLKSIQAEMDALTQAFERAVRENTRTLTFTEDELKGVPETFLKNQKRTESGLVQVGLSYPEYEAVMGYAESEAIRKAIYLTFTQRGGPENLERLNRINQLRQELSTLLGAAHYAQWVLAERMAKTPDAVNHFLDQVADAVEPIEAQDRDTLRQLKIDHLKQGDVILNRWDILFYENRLKKQRYSIDQDALRRYFPPEASMKWAFFLAKHLYEIDFEAIEIPAWHTDVKIYKVIDLRTRQILGTLYLDLYPRTGKYNHAAAFGVRTRSQLLERRPISVLVTNLNRDGLTHNELETLLHEFGHTLHGVLSEARYVLHGGTRVERDFVEAPSQMLEEWARQAETLHHLPQFCSPACPILDSAELEKLNTARKLNKGIHYARQLLYARYDMHLAQSLPGCTDAFAYWQQMERETPWGYLNESQFPGTFGHIVGGYAAGYYGYMWSEVLALDITTPFRGHWLDPKVGQRYRQLILAPGGQRPAQDMVREFLGREPSPLLFFEEITGKRS